MMIVVFIQLKKILKNFNKMKKSILLIFSLLFIVFPVIEINAQLLKKLKDKQNKLGSKVAGKMLNKMPGGKILENSSMKDFLSQLKNEKFIFYTDNKIENNLYLKDKGFKVIDDTSIEVSLSSDSDINTLINELSNNGIKVKSLKNKTNRLEELFMRLVDKNGK